MITSCRTSRMDPANLITQGIIFPTIIITKLAVQQRFSEREVHMRRHFFYRKLVVFLAATGPMGVLC